MALSIGDNGGQVEGRLRAVLGWDIGGVNTKAVRWPDLEGRSAAYEIQRDPAALIPTLRALAESLECTRDVIHAVTMTAELSQAFRSKREGVAFVLDAVEQAFPDVRVLVYAVSDRYLSPAEARARPLAVGASNWAATATLVGRHLADGLLVDIGTTSTDIVPIVGGRVAATGWTDPERLASGELVYTGALRTPTEAVATPCPSGARRARYRRKGSPSSGTRICGSGGSPPRTTRCAPPTAGRPSARTPGSGSRVWYARTGRCWTRPPSTRSPARWSSRRWPPSRRRSSGYDHAIPPSGHRKVGQPAKEAPPPSPNYTRLTLASRP